MNQQEALLEVKQSELKLVPMWDSGLAGRGLTTCYGTAAPCSRFQCCCLPWVLFQQLGSLLYILLEGSTLIYTLFAILLLARVIVLKAFSGHSDPLCLTFGTNWKCLGIGVSISCLF